MKTEKRHIKGWIACLLMLLLTACADSGDAVSPPHEADTPDPVLTIYVYAPERPVITRARDITATSDENVIRQLQIWVFETGTDRLVSYLNPKDMPTSDEGTVYQMTVSNDFARAAVKPNVDVYVVANAPAAGLSLSESTTRSALEEARIGTAYFGVAAPTTLIPDGLPMSGVLHGQPVVGEAPVLRIGNYDEMAKVTLQRAVSKVCFLFSSTPGTTLTIQHITIDGGMIPVEEYLFLNDGGTYRIGSEYDTSAAQLLQTELASVNTCDDPTAYVWQGQEAQTYENLMAEGVSDGQLSQAGPYYFKETDRKISGTLTYQVDGGASSTATFSMAAKDSNSSFTRNHSWMVYAYYAAGEASGLIINCLLVADWQKGNYNYTEIGD